MKNISIYINKATDGVVAEVRFNDDYDNNLYFIASNHEDLLRKISNHIATLSDLETE